MNPRQARRARANDRLLAGAGLSMTTHASARAQELGFSIQEIVGAVRDAEQTYVCPPRYGPSRRMYQRDDLAVVVYEPTGTVITVLLRTPRLWRHGIDHRLTLAG